VTDKAHSAEKPGHHAGAVRRYTMVWLALLTLTGLTIWTGKMDLGGANIVVALVIAVTKATLVVIFFMHMMEMGPVNRLVFIVSILFAVVLILGVFGDLLTRLPVALPSGGPMPE
jgi:cytochrome c oxidase subunit 4